jgi:hypothetical protein
MIYPRVPNWFPPAAPQPMAIQELSVHFLGSPLLAGLVTGFRNWNEDNQRREQGVKQLVHSSPLRYRRTASLDPAHGSELWEATPIEPPACEQQKSHQTGGEEKGQHGLTR